MEKIFDIAKDSEQKWGVIAQGIDGNFKEVEELKKNLQVYQQKSWENVVYNGSGHYRTLQSTSKLDSVGDNYISDYFKVSSGTKLHFEVSSRYTSAGIFGLVYFQEGESIVSGKNVTIVQNVDSVSEYSFDYTPDADGYLFVQRKINNVDISSEVTELVVSDNFIDFQSEIGRIDNRIDDLETRIPSIPTIHIPEKVYAVVGDTLQLFYRSIISCLDLKDYDIRFISTKGQSYPRYYEYNPEASDIGTNALTIEIRDSEGNTIVSKEVSLITVPAPVSPLSQLNIATFGDSLSSQGIWQHELERRITSQDETNGVFPAGNNLSNISLVGTMVKENTRYFGIGGWAWENYATQGSRGYRFQVSGVTNLVVGATYTQNGVTYTIVEVNITGGEGNILTRSNSETVVPDISGTLVRSSTDGDASIAYFSVAPDASNPLWNSDENKVSYIPYINKCTNNGEVGLISFLLGWNILYVDLSPNTSYIKTLVETAHEEYPDARIALIGVQLPSLNGGLSANYSQTSPLADLQWLINRVHAYNDFITNISEEYSYVDYVDVASQFDSENNMMEALFNVNSRNEKKEYRGTNGIHPSYSGYYQIADVLYRYIVSRFCQNGL
ncbi:MULTISPECIES: SGNH/GDSL hydrolase family protein [Bacteroides]|jgi:hypothetical protein|uniref:SGNH/GDSL hydrolase family protein n=1 Tax=Bacteroides TaxID=816 RepID=UPI002069A1E2|nr:SGNH/GDSL hydrolase family protein [Bacteroides ovatus]DAE64053.1 MAG TPA: hypothetical protein [Caudoviricetes sp.]DAV80098.1 MAG TPA: hypothetical protein [Caudoviricetes sp.]